MAVLPLPRISNRPDVLARLRDQINCLEEVQRRFTKTVSVCPAIDEFLPHRGLPLGCMHEIKGSSLASAIAFASLLSAQIAPAKKILYVAPDRHFYPLGVLPYRAKLEQWVHVCAPRWRNLAWTVLEAMRCSQIGAVLVAASISDLTFCRKLQLAAEDSGVTGFLLGNAASQPSASAITRWRVSSINHLEGTSFHEAAWQIELLYCRHGRPGVWNTIWRDAQLMAFDLPAARVQQDERRLRVGMR